VTRADRVAEVLAERELDCLLVTNLVNVRWLTGFTGTNGACIVGRDERVFLTDFRYVEQAAQQVTGFERLPAGRDLAADLAARLTGRAGFEDQHMSVRQHGKLSEKLPEGAEFVAAGGIVERLREVKDADELDRIAAAAALADDALAAELERGLIGRTESEFALALEMGMRARGAEEPSFPSIVAAGPHGALPHAEPRAVEIPAGVLVTVDWGARLDGYCSDCTRTFATGPLSDSAREVYELVLQAQEAGLAAVAPGAGCVEVDAVARDVIEAAGHGEHFGHGLGHGVGLEVHEEPRLSKLGKGELEANQVVTVEPGVYVPGELGVRIEDLVVVGEETRVFSSLPKDLQTVS
jgi:Xaa-Pro aminopeptidase